MIVYYSILYDVSVRARILRERRSQLRANNDINSNNNNNINNNNEEDDNNNSTSNYMNLCTLLLTQTPIGAPPQFPLVPGCYESEGASCV